MSQEDFWILFSKKLAGEATPEELLELEQLIRQHPEWQYALQNLEDIWRSQRPAPGIESEDAWLLHLQKMTENNIPFDAAYDDQPLGKDTRFSRKKRLRTIYTMTGIAASLLLACLILYINWPSKKNEATKAPNFNIITTRLGSTSNIQLPDGSVVWLNAGSKLTYNKDFGKGIREVLLSGEGFFDIVKDPTRPFLIHATSIDIKVLGTAFNVRAYPEDKTSEISLIRGRIEVSLKNRSNDKINLSPNEKLIVDNTLATTSGDTTLSQRPHQEPLVLINKIQPNPRDSSIDEIQWIDNKLVFNDEPFHELAARIERKYGVEITIKDAVLQQKRFTGSFTNETIEQAMEALTITSPFLYERKNNQIIIHR
jgi:ferric-dicitrate binding protein FerR (iron transport regulator)